MSLLRFCLLALVLAQRARESVGDGEGGSADMENTATGRGNTEEDGTSGPIEITDTGRGGGSKADGDEDAGQANMSMGPIIAGVGFCVCFAAVVAYLCRKEYTEKIEEEKKHAEEEKTHEEVKQKHVVGSQWRALRSDARMREEADLTSAVVAGIITEGDVIEQVDGPVWVGQHERIKIRTVGAVPVEGWVTPDARPQGPVFMVAMTAEDVDVFI